MWTILFAPAALALPPMEVAIEVGSLHNGDSAYDVVSDEDIVTSVGLRGGIAVAGPLHVVVGWHRASQGASVFAGETAFQSAYQANEWTGGLKGVWHLHDVIQPYVSAQALVLQGAFKFDGDASDDDNIDQLVERAVHPGGMATLGACATVPLPDWPAQPALWLEGGIAGVSRATYGNFGDMAAGGFIFRAGAGVQF